MFVKTHTGEWIDNKKKTIPQQKMQYSDLWIISDGVENFT